MQLTKEEKRMLEDMRKSYFDQANLIPGWRQMSKTELANGYIAHEGQEPGESQYFSALMCRYWPAVYKFCQNSQSVRLQPEDFVGWVSDALALAFKYRRWIDPTNKLYSDPNGPDKVINRCLATIRVRYYHDCNLNRSKVNYRCDSIDRQLEEFGFAATAYEAMGAKDVYEMPSEALVSGALDGGDVASAVILDFIGFQDSFRETPVRVKTGVLDDGGKEIAYSKTDYSFSAAKLIEGLQTIDGGYVRYFCDRYGTSENEVSGLATELSALEKPKIRSLVKSTLERLRNNPEVKSLLCC